MREGHAQVREVLDSINASWRSGNPRNMLVHLHPEITMALPDFQGVVRGREALISSFEEFCRNARVIDYEESDYSIEVVCGCAIATYRFHMSYERPGYREVSTGRDLWIFQRQKDGWVAVWRTMLDLKGERSPSSSSS